jgi:molybdate transport system regulatory protein
MKAGARNKLMANVTAAPMASVLTTESLEELGLKVGDTVELLVKAVHVLPVKP